MKDVVMNSAFSLLKRWPFDASELQHGGLSSMAMCRRVLCGSIPVARGFSGKRGAPLTPESKARRRVIARFYWEEPQHSYRVREVCIAAENSRVTGIYATTLLPGEPIAAEQAADDGHAGTERAVVAEYLSCDQAGAGQLTEASRWPSVSAVAWEISDVILLRRQDTRQGRPRHRDPASADAPETWRNLDAKAAVAVDSAACAGLGRHRAVARDGGACA